MKTNSYYREITVDRIDEFFIKGFNKRYFFPHRIYYFPKCGPDGYKLAHKMRRNSDPNKLWEVILYAISPVIDEFPIELFFDDDLFWHQQQFGKIGQIATATLILDGKSLYSMVHMSDLVQRISRRKDYKSRVNSRFKGWPYILFNSIMNFAIENDIKNVYSPTSDFAMIHTDQKRVVQRELFERVYDRAVRDHYIAENQGEWWAIDVARNKDRIIIPRIDHDTLNYGKTICIFHDTERGLGHVDSDPQFASMVNITAPNHLKEMLRIESEVNAKVTYNVLGCLVEEVRGEIEGEGQCVAFHSYDHSIDNLWPPSIGKLLRYARRKSGKAGQLSKCRQVDYRIKGYRPPRSKLTTDSNDHNLCFFNFEWLANSARSLKTRSPIMENRIVKIPIVLDDFAMYKRGMEYYEWEQQAMNKIERYDFIAIGLHDCYAQFWLHEYRGFLNKIKGLGELKSMNEVANEVIFSNSR